VVTVIIVSLLFSFAILIESMGVWFRFVGSAVGEAALGYSTHVRVATLGRFFILLSAPMMGYLIDGGANASLIASIGALSMLCVFIGLAPFLNANRVHVFIYIYGIMNNRKSCPNIDLSSIGQRDLSTSGQLLVVSCISFMATASGVLLVNFIAAKFPENRAMLVQMAAMITMLGTIFHAFYVDPILAEQCDNDHITAHQSIKTFLQGRVLGALLLVVFYIGLYLYG
jgi:hypothetical protein